MLSKNSIEGKEFHYFDISYVNGYWYAWFVNNIENAIKAGGE